MIGVLRPTLERAVAREAVEVLLANWRGHATVPSASLYPHQWSWDSAFVAFGLRHFAPHRAATELLSLFGAQWADGRVPHIVFNAAVAEDAYFPGPSFWRSADVPDAPPVATSGIIQPPVHAVAAAAVLRALGDDGPGFGRRIYPYLVGQNRYLRHRRTRPGSGLAFAVHPWETGMDNLPAWDQPLAAVPADLGVFAEHTRRDLDHAGDGERPTDEDYARYIRLAARYRDSGYDDDRAASEAEFRVVDPAFNALWAWSELALAEIAEVIGEPVEPHQAEAARVTAALEAELWSEEDGAVLARDDRSGAALPARCVSSLIPVVLPGLAEPVRKSLLDLLRGPAFGVGRDDVLGVPSFDLEAPGFDAQRYWRGPSWLNMTWLVARGLEVHGEGELSAHLQADIVALAERSGLREYFNPYTGSGHGTDRFSWSAALVLDVLASA